MVGAVGLGALFVATLVVSVLALTSGNGTSVPAMSEAGRPTASPAPKPVWYPAAEAPVSVTGGPAEIYGADGKDWMRNGLMTEKGTSWLGPRNGGASLWISFLTDAPTITPVYQAINGRIRHMVDGAWVNETTSLPIGTNAGWMQTIKIDGPQTMRRIDLRMDEAPFSGLEIPAGYTVEPAPVGTTIAANIGDSYSESNMSLPQAGTDRMEGQIYTMGRALGIEKDILNDAIGGRGYTNPGEGGGRKTFLDSVEKDFAPLPQELRPDFFTVWGGYNDGGATQTELRDAAAATYAAIDRHFPGVPVFVIFNGDRPEPAISATQQKTMRDTIQSAALSAPNVVSFIDGIAGTWYPGALAKSPAPSTPPAPWLTEDNVGTMIGADKVHGTPDYYKAVGPVVAQAIKESFGGVVPGAS